MPISFHTGYDSSAKARDLLKEIEKLRDVPYRDADHTVTLGYGYTLVRGGADNWTRYVKADTDLRQIGITLSQAQIDNLEDVATALKAKDTAKADSKVAEFIRSWTAPKLTEPNASKLLEIALATTEGEVRGRLTKLLGAKDGQALYDSLEGTREKAGLLFMAFNGAGLIGSGLATAMRDGDRAKAWFEIRYNSNAGKLPGLAKRRFFEAETIGLYADYDAPTAKEAADAYRMLDANKITIFNYEKNYGNPVDGSKANAGDRVAAAQNDLKDLITALGLTRVPTIEQAFSPTKDFLLNSLRTGGQLSAQEVAALPANDAVKATALYLAMPDAAGNAVAGNLNAEFFELDYGKDGSNDLLIGSSLGDQLVGGKGNDTLIGGGGVDYLEDGAGDDVLVGGEGADYLYGGEGFDTYRAGNGDCIGDADAKGLVYVGTLQLTGGSRLKKDGADAVFKGSNGSTYRLKDKNTLMVHTAQGDVKIATAAFTSETQQGATILHGLGITLTTYDNNKPIGPDGNSDFPPDIPPDIPPYTPTEGDPYTGLPWPGNPDDWGNDFGVAERTTSPLVLDLNGDGVKTTALVDGAYGGAHFNLDAKGLAEQTGWVDQADGLLVRDLNGDGQITSGRELFGNHTLLTQGPNAGKEAANGFQALQELDGNGDGLVDVNDAAFNTLQVWKDANGNGVTDAGELLSLAEAGVQNLKLAYTTGATPDAQGNIHQQQGSFTLSRKPW